MRLGATPTDRRTVLTAGAVQLLHLLSRRAARADSQQAPADAGATPGQGPPVVQDTFDRPDTSPAMVNPLGSTPQGHAWRSTGSAVPYIENGRMVYDQPGTYYAHLQLDTVPSRIGGHISIVEDGGEPGPAFALIASAFAGKAWDIRDMVHLVVADDGFALHVTDPRENPEPPHLVNLAEGPLSLRRDGTVYPVSMAIDGDTVTLDLPDGTTVEFTDDRLADHWGQWAVWEVSGNRTPNGHRYRWDDVEVG